MCVCVVRGSVFLFAVGGGWRRGGGGELFWLFGPAPAAKTKYSYRSSIGGLRVSGYRGLTDPWVYTFGV